MAVAVSPTRADPSELDCTELNKELQSLKDFWKANGPDVMRDSGGAKRAKLVAFMLKEQSIHNQFEASAYIQLYNDQDELISIIAAARMKSSKQWLAGPQLLRVLQNTVVEETSYLADQTNLRMLQASLEIYEAREGKKPQKLEDLVPDYVESVPEAYATGASFEYDPKTGQVNYVGGPKILPKTTTQGKATHLRAIRAALELYEARTGSKPKQLSDLVPEYLDEIPADMKVQYDPKTGQVVAE